MKTLFKILFIGTALMVLMAMFGGFALLNQTQALTQHFAGVLVTPTGNQLFHQESLMVGEHNVASRHGGFLGKLHWQIMPMFIIFTQKSAFNLL